MIAHFHTGTDVPLTNYARYFYPTPRLTALIEGHRISPGQTFTFQGRSWAITKATYIPVPMHIPNIQSSSDALLSFIIPVNTQITAKLMNKQYYYRNGQLATILTTDSRDIDYPIRTKDPNNRLHTHSATGKIYANDIDPHPFDLMDYPAPPPPFDPAKPCRYRNGKPALVLMTTAPEPWPIITQTPDGDRRSHRANGRYLQEQDGEHSYDLLNIPRRLTFTSWANVLLSISGTPYLQTHSSRESADKAAGCRIACIPVPVDCEEGEGLH